MIGGHLRCPFIWFTSHRTSAIASWRCSNYFAASRLQDYIGNFLYDLTAHLLSIFLHWCPAKILTISISLNYTMDYLCFSEHGLIAENRRNNLSTATRREPRCGVRCTKQTRPVRGSWWVCRPCPDFARSVGDSDGPVPGGT